MNSTEWTAKDRLSWLDCFRTLPVVLRMCFSKAKFWTFCLVAIIVASTVIPVSGEYRPLRYMGGVAVTIAVSAISCLIVAGYWSQLKGQEWQPSDRQVARVGKVWVMSEMYNLGVLLGLVLLIVPGILLAVRSSLALVLICLEKRGPIAAINDSAKLTENKFWLVARYFALPSLIILFFLLVYPMLLALVDPSALEDDAYSSWAWLAAHPLIMGLHILGELIGTFMQINLAAMQVRMYQFLKEGPLATG